MCLLFFYLSSAMKFGSSPRQRYSSHVDEVPQSFLRRKISSVKVEPDAPMKTLDIAHIVLSNIASTCISQKPTTKQVNTREKRVLSYIIEQRPLEDHRVPLDFTGVKYQTGDRVSSDFYRTK